MEFKKARVEKVMPVETGTSERGEWTSQSIVVSEDLPMPYPDRVRVDFKGDKLAQLEGIKEGDTVHIIWTAGVSERKVERDGKVCVFITGYNRGFLIEKL